MSTEPITNPDLNANPNHYFSPTDPTLYALPSYDPHPTYKTESALRVLRHFCNAHQHTPPSFTERNYPGPCRVQVLKDDYQNGELAFITSFGLLVHIKERLKPNGERQALIKKMCLYGNVGERDEEPGEDGVGGVDWRRQWSEIEEGQMWDNVANGGFRYVDTDLWHTAVGYKTLKIRQWDGRFDVCGVEQSEKDLHSGLEEPAVPEMVGLQSYCPNTFPGLVKWAAWGRKLMFPARFNNMSQYPYHDTDQDLDEEAFGVDADDLSKSLEPGVVDEDRYIMWLIEGMLLSAAMVLEDGEVVEKVMFEVCDENYSQLWYLWDHSVHAKNPGLGVVAFLEDMDWRIAEFHKGIHMEDGYNMFVKEV